MPEADAVSGIAPIQDFSYADIYNTKLRLNGV
jgi:hypothetical protein